ncbi:MAG: hypothetical protein LBL61_02665 [Elusimicrobiota bacterium]|nr:hypothetical protein [Elusimicrobiota bacterium]
MTAKSRLLQTGLRNDDIKLYCFARWNCSLAMMDIRQDCFGAWNYAPARTT